MKFCTKCGKEIHDNTVLCPFCGRAGDSATSAELKNHPIIKTSYGKLFGLSMLSGLGFGIIMALIFNTNYFIGLCSGLAFGILFFVGMAAVNLFMEDTILKDIRRDVSLNSRIYLEGGANYSGNGGWLFVTEEGIEYRAHKFNFDSKSIKIPHDKIICIEKEKNFLLMSTPDTTYKFTVSNMNQWLTLLESCPLTKDKL